MGSDTALVTKLRGRFGKYLNPQQLSRLLEETTLEGAFRVLREIVGKDIGDFHDVRTGEQRLEAWKRQRNDELLTFLDAKQKQFLHSFFMEDELLELQRFLRVLQRDNRKEQLLFIQHSIYADTLHLTADTSISVPAYLSTLKEKPYYRLLEPIVQNDVDTGSIDFDSLMVNFNRWYFHRLRREAKDIGGKTAVVLDDLLGTMIDLRNITWIVHTKRFLRDEDPYLAMQMVPGGKILYGKTLENVVSLDLPAFTVWLRQSPYRSLIEGGKEDYSFLPIARQRYLYRRCRKIFSLTDDGLLAAVCFIHMLNGRIAEIRRILEAINLGWKEEQMIQYLIEWKTE